MAAQWQARDRVMALLIAEEAEQDAMNARLEERYQELSDEDKAEDDARSLPMRRYTRSLGSGLVSIEDIERAIAGDVLFVPAVLLAMIGTVKWHHAKVDAENTREGRPTRYRVVLTMSTRDVRAAMENDPEGIMDFFKRQDFMNSLGAMTDEETGPFTVL